MSSIARLLMPKNEAERFIQNQIQRGRAISIKDISLDAVNIAVEKVKKWEEETIEILTKMFDSDEIAQEFIDAAALYKLENDFRSKLNFTSDRIIYKNYSLEEIKERLSFYEVEASEEVLEPQFWDSIHPSITGLCKSRFDAGHYADCVETAFKHINETIKNKIKKKTGKELDGAALMNIALSPNNPILVLDDLSTESGKNIQQGYMMMFAGAMTGIRNPKAHGVVTIDKEEAIHLLFFASLLMHKYDQAI